MIASLVITLTLDVERVEVVLPVVDEDLVASSNVIIRLEEHHETLAVHALFYNEVRLTVVIHKPCHIPEPTGSTARNQEVESVLITRIKPVITRDQLAQVLAKDSPVWNWCVGEQTLHTLSQQRSSNVAQIFRSWLITRDLRPLTQFSSQRMGGRKKEATNPTKITCSSYIK